MLKDRFGEGTARASPPPKPSNSYFRVIEFSDILNYKSTGISIGFMIMVFRYLGPGAPKLQVKI